MFWVEMTWDDCFVLVAPLEIFKPKQLFEDSEIPLASELMTAAVSTWLHGCPSPLKENVLVSHCVANKPHAESGALGSGFVFTNKWPHDHKQILCSVLGAALGPSRGWWWADLAGQWSLIFFSEYLIGTSINGCWIHVNYYTWPGTKFIFCALALLGVLVQRNWVLYLFWTLLPSAKEANGLERFIYLSFLYF